MDVNFQIVDNAFTRLTIKYQLTKIVYKVQYIHERDGIDISQMRTIYSFVGLFSPKNLSIFMAIVKKLWLVGIYDNELNKIYYLWTDDKNIINIYGTCRKRCQAHIDAYISVSSS